MAGSGRNPRGSCALFLGYMAMFFGGGILILVAAVLIATSFQYPALPVDAASVAAEELQSGMGLSFKNAVLLDQYASSGAGDRVDAYHCVTAFSVAEGRKVIASLRVPTEGWLYEIMCDYMDDEDAGLGDCKVTLCATTAPLDGKLSEYLNAYVKDTFGELTPYRVVPLGRTLRGETEWEYTDSVLRERKTCRAAGALCLLAGSALLFAAMRRRRV